MRKLRLSHDDLQVESFAVSNDEGPRGTVMGKEQEGTPPTWNYPYDWNCQSYQATCYNQGCGTGLTSLCSMAATECPGQGECGQFSEDYTCFGSCTEFQGCTFCGAFC
jgi:hypothetical protein